MVWEWPQITWAILAVIGLVIAAVIDGEQKTGKHSAAVTLIGTLLSAVLLYYGGFFTEVRP